MEVIRLFDSSFSKAQVSKMYFDAIAESGSDKITQKAFLKIGDKVPAASKINIFVV